MSEFLIKTIELPLAKDEYEHLYGISVERPRTDSLEQILFDQRAQVVAKNGLARQLGITPLDKVVVYAPEFVLKEAPTKEQIKQFNDDNTQTVAAYTVGIQRDLEQVPIVESREKLLHLPELFTSYDIPAGFSDTAFHEACGEWAGKPRQYWAREQFAKRLLVMGDILKSQGLELYFEDAFRPLGVQEGLFKRRVAWTKNDHPEWTSEQVIQEAKSKTAVKPRLASHKGAAAVDARLRSISTGEILDFGHNYPDGGALVFPQTTFITESQWLHRQTFQSAAGLSGLTLYVGEDWHVSYGDNLASIDFDGRVRKEYIAKYGPIKDFDRQTGEISRYYSNEEIDRTFDF